MDAYGLNLDDWRQIRRWNRLPPPRTQGCLHNLIKKRAAIEPEKIALCSWDGQLTYRELVSAVNHLSAWLVGRGVTGGSRVCLYMEKSKYAVIVMLAIMQAGATWVPLDLSHPMKHIQEIVTKSEASFVAVSETTAGTFHEDKELKTLVIGSELCCDIHVESDTIDVSPEETAFIMFTSGSTGKPSGVVISHSAMATAATFYSTHLNIDNKSRVMQFAAFIWLPCTVEIIATLIAGGTVCIPSEHERLNNPADFMYRHKITTAVLAPSFMGALSPESVPCLKVLGLGGEKIPQSIVDDWATSSVKLVLCYGSTETNLCILQTIIAGSSDSHTSGVPVGARAWITNPEDVNLLAPIGTVGELIIESWALADGYLNDVEKTNAKFFTKPCWLNSDAPSNDARLCRVGDLARYNPDGTIQILGRKGNSTVKIRGQKVELNDVESLIQQLLPKAMKVAVISATMAGELSSRLIAFISLGQEENPDQAGAGLVVDTVQDQPQLSEVISKLQSDLCAEAPSHMVPAMFISLYRFPLTVSGKLDRPELVRIAETQMIDSLVSRSKEARKTLSSSGEKLMCSLWSSILKIPEDLIAPDDHFFRLGGDSVKAIALVSACRQNNVQLDFRSIFQRPTLQDMTNASTVVENNATDFKNEIKPYSLVPGGLEHADRFRQEISSKYGIDESLIEDIYPTTPLQGGLIALSMKRPGAYTVRTSFSLDGIVIQKIRDAWRIVTERNPILRTRIVHVSNTLMQVVMKSTDLDHSTQHNWGDLECDQNITMQLGDPLSRIAVSDTPPRLVWIAHHALLDAWSMTQVLRQLELAYQDVELPPHHIGLNSFIQYLNLIDTDAQDRFWYEQLEDAIPTNWPPVPKSDSQIQTTSSVKHPIIIPEISSKFRDINITPACILRAAWAILLSKYSNSEDVIFHSTLSGRAAPIAGINEIIGPTIATVPVRIRCDSNKSVFEFLDDVQTQSTAMIPFEQAGIQRIRRLSAEIQQVCDCKTLFIVQTTMKDSTLEFRNSAVEVEDWKDFAAYPIVVEAILSPEGALCRATYDPTILNRFQVEAIIFQFEHVVKQLCSDDSIELLGGVEAFSPHDNLHIQKWNKDMPPTIDSCAHHELEHRVSLHPNHLAVDSWDGNLTYQELDALATQLAHHLQEVHTIGCEDIIPVIFTKSKWCIVSMLAVWKSGGAFALIDIGHPAKWIETIVRGTRARIVLCSESALSSIEPDLTGIVIDERFLSGLPQNEKDITSPVKSSNAAYIIHSSGSTGTPKGIVHTHSSYLSGVFNRIPTMIKGCKDRVLQFASYSFDISIDDIWTTLLVGGTVCIPSEHERLNDLANFMNRAKITYAELTPSLARTLDPEKITHLRTIALSGEASTKLDRERWLGHTTVLDEYGPAEVAIKSHMKRVERVSHSFDKGHQVACLGWITEPQNHEKLQAMGAIGELLLEGPILSRGYLDQPERTSEVFIENPSWLPVERFGPRRLYKTGDMASYNSDGSIRIHGRWDHQVKIRGQRVELSHIEHVIEQSLPIKATAVVDLASINNSSSKSSLVVFLPREAIDNNNPATRFIMNRLYQRLSETLPTYMIPSLVILVDYMPLNRSGKTDRQKLKSYAATLSKNDVIFLSDDPDTKLVSRKTAPSSLAEKWLQDLWAQVLDINPDAISVDDNFLHLGGDSILAMKMVALASEMGNTDYSLTVPCIYQNPRLSCMAVAMSTIRAEQIPDGYLEVSSVHKFDMLPESKKPSEVINAAANICRVNIDEIEDIYPCSPLQASLMEVSTIRPGYYVAQHTFLLPPNVDLIKLQLAWQAMISKLSILRTRIVQLGKDLFQVVVRQPLAEWVSQECLQTYLQSDLRVPMNFGSPLNRLAIILESPARRYLVWTAHHAIYDGYSLQLILDAVAQVYKFGADSWHPVIEFKHFIRYLTAIDKASHADFWLTTLDGVAESSSMFPKLPKSGYKPNAQSTIEMRIQAPTTKIKGITTASLFHAAWTLITAKYMESTDLIIGVTVNGRNVPLPKIDQNPGPVFTTVPSRTRIVLESSIADFLQQVQDDAVKLIPYQHFGLRNISSLSDDTKRACELISLLVIHSEEQLSDPYNDTFGQRQVFQDYTRFNPYTMLVQFMPLGGGDMLVNVSYDDNVLSEVQVRRLLKQLENVIEIMSSVDSSTPLSDITVLSYEEKAQINKWNNLDMPLEPKMTTIHEVFEQQVARYPLSQAIHAWDGDLTYKELDSMSSRLALLLQGLVTTGDIVPVCFEKSKWAVISIFAILKVGGAFVLLDPSHPLPRLKAMIRDTKARVVLSSTANTFFFAGEVAHIINPSDSESLLNLPLDLTNCVWKVSADDLACLIFTSGSTGKPKGIKFAHRTICSSVAAHGPALNINQKSRVLQFASYAFDMALYDICTTLIFGGCVCIPSEHDKMNNLPKVISDMDVNWAFFTPSTLSLLNPGMVPTLETLVVSGEPVTQEICDKWADRVRLIQCAGPAETTISIAGEMTSGSQKNCLGKGLGVRCWIVDPSNHNVLCPIGIVGELLVEGPSVAEGYLDPSDNKENVFLDMLPKWATEQSIGISLGNGNGMYKTGDLVQYDSDGNLLFLGRKDQQYKIRGQRVEIGEIEECLNRSFRDLNIIVDVIKPSWDPERSILAAFMAHTTANSVSSKSMIMDKHERSQHEILDSIQNSLAQSLPQYMIPSIIIPLSSIPLNGSGKLDRRHLRELGAQLSRSQLSLFAARKGAQQKPEGSMEQKLASLWADVLRVNVSSIGRDDNFFRLGGDSLYAMQLAREACDRGISLPVMQIFQAPSLCAMACAATTCPDHDLRYVPFELLGGPEEAESIKVTCATLLKVNESIITDIYACTPLQEGLMALSVQRAGAYTMQQMFELSSDIDVSRFQEACEVVYASTPILRTRIVQLKTSQMVQVVLDENLPWQKHDTVDEYLENDTNRPIQLGDPLVRWALVGSDCRTFVWTLHHCSYDGQSFVLLLQAIQDAYFKKQPLNLGKHQYGSFIRALKNIPEYDQRRYWEKQLDGASRCLFPENANSQNRASRPDATHSIDISLTRSTSRTCNTTIPTAVRAAWGFLLGLYTRSTDVVFGMTVSGRNTPVRGIEEIIGPTFSTVPVRVRMDYSMKIAKFLDYIQAEAVEMTPFEQYGLHRIKQLNPEAFSACSFDNLLVIQPRSMLALQDNSVLRVQSRARHMTTPFRTYALTIICQLNDEDGATLTANFDEGIIGRQQVCRLLTQFESVIQQMIGGSNDGQLKDIHLLTAADENEIWTWNKEIACEENTCVHQVIEKKIEETPNSPAVHAWDGTLTYSELDWLASKLADHLLTQNIGAGHRIPILFEKSKWAVVSVLAILRCGAAFVPIDPSYPKIRLEHMIRHVQPPLVLTSSKYRELGIELAGKVLEVCEKSIRQFCLTNRWKTVSLDPQCPAYVNFTSGTTGTPKASVIEHRNYCSGAVGHIPKIGISNDSRVLQFASYGFDTCIEDILTTLMVGACICIPSQIQRDSDIVGAIRDYNVNWAHLTPSYARSIDATRVPSLKVLLLGGEALTSHDVNRWKDHVHLINVYGPSELCVTCSVNPNVSTSSDSANIGRAIGGAATWVVDTDDHHKLAPIGTIGELLVEGPLMARGYLHDEALTAKSFIGAPPWLRTGGRSGRLYKTGDLVRYHWDGTLVYIGRKDDQRKLRGQRIELDDIVQNIQALNSGFPGMIAAEIVHPLDCETPALAVFIGNTAGESVDNTEAIIGQIDGTFSRCVEEIQQRLPERLPLHMIPSFYIPVTSMPLTSSKKVNRAALRNAAATRTAAELQSFSCGRDELRQPTGPLQRQLQSIWTRVLNKPPESIPINISFLTNGGDSISAMQFLAGCRELDLPVTLQEIMTHSTIEQLARQIESRLP